MIGRAVAFYLEKEGVGKFGEDLYLGTRPSSPVGCLTVYDSGGFKPRKDGTADPLIQIISRDKYYMAAFSRIERAHLILKEGYHFWLDEGILVLRLETAGEPGKIGRDDNQNTLVSCNYNFWVKYF